MKRAALCLLLLAGCAESGRRVPSSILRPAAAATATPRGELAFVSERDGHAQVFTKRPGEAARKLTDVAGSAFIGPVGPHDEIVVVTSRGHGEAATEQLHLLEGGTLSPMSPASRFARNPSWLPDGQRLVYESNLAGFRNLFLLDRHGEPEQLTDCEHGCFEPAVSPDGQRVAFASPDSGDGEIYVLDLVSRHRQRLTWSPGIDKQPAWSPGGDRLAFISRRGTGARLFVMNADGSRPRMLSRRDAEAREEKEHVWSPDGTHIAFVAMRQQRANLRVVRVADGELVASAEGPWIDQTPAWTTDEHLVFASNRDGNTEIYMMRRDATGLRRMTDHPSPDWLPRWL